MKRSISWGKGKDEKLLLPRPDVVTCCHSMCVQGPTSSAVPGVWRVAANPAAAELTVASNQAEVHKMGTPVAASAGNNRAQFICSALTPACGLKSSMKETTAASFAVSQFCPLRAASAWAKISARRLRSARRSARPNGGEPGVGSSSAGRARANPRASRPSKPAASGASPRRCESNAFTSAAQWCVNCFWGTPPGSDTLSNMSRKGLIATTAAMLEGGAAAAVARAQPAS